MALRWCQCGDVGQSPGGCCEKGPDGWRSEGREVLSMLMFLSRAGRCRWLLSWQCGKGQWCRLKLKAVMLTAGQHVCLTC